MEKYSERELKNRLLEAAQLVSVGARYAHYKHPEHAYLVTGIALREDTQEAAVLYEAQYGERLPFIRTLQSFVERVEINGVSVPRFSRLP